MFLHDLLFSQTKTYKIPIVLAVKKSIDTSVSIYYFLKQMLHRRNMVDKTKLLHVLISSPLLLKKVQTFDTFYGVNDSKTIKIMLLKKSLFSLI